MAWRNFEWMYTLVLSPLYHSARVRWIYSASYIPVLLTGVVGWFQLRRRWRELSLLWGWVLTTTLLYCFYSTVVRYRIPTIDPVLMVGTGVCLAALLEAGRRGRQPTGDSSSG